MLFDIGHDSFLRLAWRAGSRDQWAVLKICGPVVPCPSNVISFGRSAAEWWIRVHWSLWLEDTQDCGGRFVRHWRMTSRGLVLRCIRSERKKNGWLQRSLWNSSWQMPSKQVVIFLSWSSHRPSLNRDLNTSLSCSSGRAKWFLKTIQLYINFTPPWRQIWISVALSFWILNWPRVQSHLLVPGSEDRFRNFSSSIYVGLVAVTWPCHQIQLFQVVL